MNFAPLKESIRLALREDAASRDLTTRLLVPPSHRGKAVFLAKQPMVVCGLPVVREVFRLLDRRVRFRMLVKEGKKVGRGKILAELSGPTRALLSGERVALNFLQRLSGIATLTATYVQAVRGTKVKLLDTRKTTPGLRFLEKYAVRTGGGVNHRADLASAIMIKDNHLAVISSLGEAVAKVKILKPKLPLIVEVKTFRQLEEALAARATHILLDNMSVGELRKAVQWTRGRARLEASGGVSLGNVRRIARTGVGFISVGALTHSAPAVDISMELVGKGLLKLP